MNRTKPIRSITDESDRVRAAAIASDRNVVSIIGHLSETEFLLDTELLKTDVS